MSVYRDPVLLKLRDVLNQYGPKQLKNRYYFGDPLIVNASELPACFMSIDSQTVDNVTNAELETRIFVVLNVVYDHRRDLMQALDNIESHMSIVDLIGGRNEDYSLKADSILGCLRAHEDLDTKLWIDVGSLSTADYGVGVEKRGPGIYTAEGIIRVQIINHSIKPEYSA